MDMACAKETYRQYHRISTAMDTRREKKTRSNQEHMENDRGKWNERTQINMGITGEGSSMQRQVE